MTLNSFIAPYNNAVVKAIQELNALVASYNGAKDELAQVEADKKLYSPEGYRVKAEPLRAQIDDIVGKMYAISRGFEDTDRQTRQEIQNAFAAKYAINPADIDSNAVLLLDKGLVTDSELEELAERYSGNVAMSRVIGDAMKRQGEKSGNTALSFKGQSLLDKADKNPALSAFDALSGVASRALHTGSGIAPLEVCLAMREAPAAEYPAKYAAAEAIAEGITTD
jgi:hypothetical protein